MSRCSPSRAGAAVRLGMAIALAAAAATALAGCEGVGAERPGWITQGPVDPRCTPIGSAYPSGIDTLPGDPDVVAVMRLGPTKSLLAYDVGVAPPRLLTPGVPPTFPTDASGRGLDSDGDGIDDAERFRALGLCPPHIPDPPGCTTYPVPGSVHVADDDLALVTTSGYEQVLFYRPLTGRLRALSVENPLPQAAHDPADRPFLPPAGGRETRTGLSTMTCVYPPVPLDSLGELVVPDPACDPDRFGFLTRFTAASLVADDALFVATSNLRTPSVARFQPGSVLVFRIDAGASPWVLRPDVESPVVFTTAFNPTGLTHHRTRAGRSLVLVTLTGAITAGGDLLGPAAVDVIDVASARLVATIPLGDAAGPAFGPIAIDPTGRIGLLGAESQRRLYAIDLAPLEDPALYAAPVTPVRLDGTTPGFPDARIHHADAPLVLPSRPDGPSLSLCNPRTNVAFAGGGEHAFASDWCDGSVTVVEVDLDGAGGAPLDRSHLRVASRLDLLHPKRPDLFGLTAAPSMVGGLAASSAVDPARPDLYLVANEPESQLCAVRVGP